MAASNTIYAVSMAFYPLEMARCLIMFMFLRDNKMCHEASTILEKFKSFSFWTLYWIKWSICSS